jgi:choline dehydrogenase-like flavoprotein
MGVKCAIDSPHVGKHLKDHIQVSLFFAAPGCGVSMDAVAQALGPDAMLEWQTTGRGLPASSLYDAAAWCSTGLGDAHSHDAQIACFVSGGAVELFDCLHVDTALYFGESSRRLATDAENVIVLANPVLPHSEGEIVLQCANPAMHPEIRMNYFADPHDMKVMVAVQRRALEIVAHWPGQKLGHPLIPPFLARKHGHSAGAVPSDALLEDLALHFSMTVYHLCCTCRIGSVVDSRLRVMGINRLRVADASVMPNIVSGNTNAACIMIGEKAAEMVAADYGVQLSEFVGTVPLADKVASQ